MNYIEQILHKEKIIIVRISGELHAKKTAEMGLAIRLKAIEHNLKIILDFRKAINRISILQAHTWFSNFYDGINKNLRFIPTVHLISDEHEEFFNFVENSWCNRGIQLKVVKDEVAAINWINNQQIKIVTSDLTPHRKGSIPNKKILEI